jgi:hypothetical protein
MWHEVVYWLHEQASVNLPPAEPGVLAATQACVLPAYQYLHSPQPCSLVMTPFGQYKIISTSTIRSALCTTVLKIGHTFLVYLFGALWRNVLITRLGLCTLLGVPALPGALQVLREQSQAAAGQQSVPKAHQS